MSSKFFSFFLSSSILLTPHFSKIEANQPAPYVTLCDLGFFKKEGSFSNYSLLNIATEFNNSLGLSYWGVSKVINFCEGALSTVMGPQSHNITSAIGLVARGGIWFLYNYFLSYPLWKGYQDAFHEIGHANVLGDDFRYFKDAQGNDIGRTFLSLWEKSTTKEFSKNQSETLLTTVGSVTAFKDNLLFYISGINNELLLAQTLEKESYLGKVAYPNFYTYFASKLAPYRYAKITNDRLNTSVSPEGDLSSLMRYANIEDHDAFLKDIMMYNAVSLALSGGFYEHIWGVFNYLKNRQYEYTPLSFYGFRMPNLDMFLGKEGIHLNAHSAFHFKFLYLNFGVEWVQKAYNKNISSSDIEFTIGGGIEIFSKDRFLQLELVKNTNSKDAIGLRFSYTTSLFIPYVYGIIGGEYFQKDTFANQRCDSPGNDNFSMFFSIKICY